MLGFKEIREPVPCTHLPHKFPQGDQLEMEGWNGLEQWLAAKAIHTAHWGVRT